MSRLILLNAAVLLMLLCAVVMPEYSINYSLHFSLINFLARFEWLIFTGIIFAGILVSVLLALVSIEKIPYVHRLLSVDAFINTGFLFFVSYHGISTIIDFQEEYEVLSLKYKAMAESDIRNGVIIYETAGFEISLDSVQELKVAKIDSLSRTYGITYHNTGCMTSAPMLRAQRDYEQLAESYLDRRNGAGWRDRMNMQIEKIKAGSSIQH